MHSYFLLPPPQHVQEKVAFRHVEKFSNTIDALLGDEHEEGGKTEEGTATEGADMLDQEKEHDVGEEQKENKEDGASVS